MSLVNTASSSQVPSEVLPVSLYVPTEELEGRGSPLAAMLAGILLAEIQGYWVAIFPQDHLQQTALSHPNNSIVALCEQGTMGAAVKWAPVNWSTPRGSTESVRNGHTIKCVFMLVTKVIVTYSLLISIYRPLLSSLGQIKILMRN